MVASDAGDKVEDPRLVDLVELHLSHGVWNRCCRHPLVLVRMHIMHIHPCPFYPPTAVKDRDLRQPERQTDRQGRLCFHRCPSVHGSWEPCGAGACAAGGRGHACMTGETATAAGGTHPTGMYSYRSLISLFVFFVTSALGFKPRMGPLACVLCYLQAMDSSD